MIELIKHGTMIDFVGKAKYVVTASVILTIVALYGILNRMNYGVDFRGGAEIQTKFEKTVHLDQLRGALSQGGLKGVSVQTIGEEKDNEVLIKVQAEEGALNTITEQISSNLQSSFPDNKVEIQKVDIVGPKAGKELRNSGMQAMFWAILSIMIYVAIRFDFRYAPGAMISLFHDIIVVAGIIAWTGHEFSLQTVAALLAIIGYSINDTVIVYDRIREHEEKDNTISFGQHINDAVNDTLSRTILTSAATLLVTVSMYFFGGAAIKDFFFAMTLGIMFGTYSSVYIAAMTTLFTSNQMKKMNVTKASKVVA
ncbi:MAG: protein translocase subunit SecF [Bacteriovorax sp.]|jgi:preprotein translocase subunit SecF